MSFSKNPIIASRDQMEDDLDLQPQPIFDFGVYRLAQEAMTDMAGRITLKQTNQEDQICKLESEEEEQRDQHYSKKWSGANYFIRDRKTFNTFIDTQLNGPN